MLPDASRFQPDDHPGLPGGASDSNAASSGGDRFVAAVGATYLSEGMGDEEDELLGKVGHCAVDYLKFEPKAS